MKNSNKFSTRMTKILVVVFCSFLWTNAAPPPCALSNTIVVDMPSVLYQNAGANKPNTYYLGLSSNLRLTANPTGSAGPFTYQWISKSGYTILNPTAKLASLAASPSGAGWVKVSITDQGTACVKLDSVFIDFVDYTCNKPLIWSYTLRNTLTNAVVCVKTTAAMRTALQTGNFVFSGSCNGFTNTISAGPPSALYQSAGANQANTYYWGLSANMRLEANPVGGVGPYSYSWISKSNYQINNSTSATAALSYPTGPGWIKLAITDVGASCTKYDSIYIDFVDFTCNQPLIWWYQLCNVNTSTSQCVQGTSNMRALLQTGNYVFGSCLVPKADLVSQSASFSVYPNPSSGLFTLEMPIAANTTGTVEVMDVNGRALYSESVSMQEGILYHTLDLGALPNGIYIVRVATDYEFATERIQIIR